MLCRGQVSTWTLRHGARPVYKERLDMRYAWRPDIPDHRDRYYKSVTMVLPKTVSKIGTKNRIEDQGNLGSCTGNSSTSALEITLGIEHQLSRLMAYYNARVIDGYVNEDAGAYIRSAIKGLVKVGVSTEDLWPYIVSKFRTKPTARAYTDATALVAANAGKIEYARVTSLPALKQCLAQRNPVVFGFMVPESFETMTKSYLLTLPKRGEAILGGHAVVAVGYNDKVSKPYIWVRNSWGQDWGLSGYFKMTQDWFLDSRRLVDDLWVIRKIK